MHDYTPLLQRDPFFSVYLNSVLCKLIIFFAVIIYTLAIIQHPSVSIQTKNFPYISKIQVAPRYTLLTLFGQFKLLYIAKTLACMPKYIVVRFERCWMQTLWASGQIVEAGLMELIG